MKTVITEYAGAVAAMLGTVLFLTIVNEIFSGKEGIFATFILFVLGGL